MKTSLRSCPHPTTPRSVKLPTWAGFALLVRIFAVFSMTVLCMELACASEELVRTRPSGATRPLGLLDAVRLTLVKNTNIQLREKQLESGQGALQQASGQFDSTLGLSVGGGLNNSPLNQQTRNSYANSGIPLSSLTTNTTSSSLALTNPLRNGIVLSTSIGTTRTTGSTTDLSNLPSQSAGMVDFSISVPLLKGRGESTAAGETAANLEWNARQQDLRFSISQSVLNTVTAYWSLVATRKNLDIANESEASARQMEEQTRTLIEADELPAADLNVLEANLLDRTASRITAEQSLLDAQQVLGQAIGLPYQQITSLELADEFPSFDTELSALERQSARLIELGMKRRADRAAAQLRQESARTLTGAAQNNLKPQLNLTLNVGYAGLAEGASVSDVTGALAQNRTGLNSGAKISYQWPFDNNAARGLMLQQSAAYDQSTINTSTVERSISMGVESALSNLVRSALKLKKSEETVKLYRITLENEKNKHKLGTATLIEVLATNDRLIGALLNNISFRLGYLSALARLSFETGALLADDQSGQSIRLNQLLSVPKLD